MIESLLFQRHLVTQINNIYGVNGMTWQAPFLDVDIINYSLAIPARYRQDHTVTKSILYNATKGLVSKIFLHVDLKETIPQVCIKVTKKP